MVEVYWLLVFSQAVDLASSQSMSLNDFVVREEAETCHISRKQGLPESTILL